MEEVDTPAWEQPGVERTRHPGHVVLRPPIGGELLQPIQRPEDEVEVVPRQVVEEELQLHGCSRRALLLLCLPGVVGDCAR